MLVSLLVLLLFCLLGVSAQPEAGGAVETLPTSESDKDALLRIRDHLQNHSTIDDTLFTNWTAASDPCADGWVHIACSCLNVQLLEGAEEICDGYNASTTESRVIILVLTGGTSADEKWSGPLSSDIGRLDRLLSLDLSQNQFSGPIPSSFANLRELRRLSLSNNNLNGFIPEYLGEFPNLRELDLDNNQFSGPIPEIGCGRGDAEDEIRVAVNDNYGLCGQLPTCMTPPVVTNLNGTFVHSPSLFNDIDQNSICDDTEPECPGCRLNVPRFWNSSTLISLDFPEFEDPESEIAGYEIVLFQVDQADVRRPLPDFTNINITNPEANSSWRNVPRPNRRQTRNFHVEHDLSDGGRTLIHNGWYNVTVIATNYAGPPLSANLSSGTVIVDTTLPTSGPVFNT